MPVQQPEQIALTGGLYEARGLIANAQRCVNLYPERNPKDAEAPYSMQLTPGLVEVGDSGTNRGWRALDLASNEELFGVCGQRV